jgi:hypothetical protein
MKPRGLAERRARRMAAGTWHLHLPSRIDGSPVMLVGDRRPTSSLAFHAAVREAIGFGRGVGSTVKPWRPLAPPAIAVRGDPGARRLASTGRLPS